MSASPQHDGASTATARARSPFVVWHARDADVGNFLHAHAQTALTALIRRAEQTFEHNGAPGAELFKVHMIRNVLIVLLMAYVSHAQAICLWSFDLPIDGPWSLLILSFKLASGKPLNALVTVISSPLPGVLAIAYPVL
eukprot:6201274-Pleurochrysis_carterae.AAC.2